MSSIDLWMRDVAINYILISILFVVITFLINSKWSRFCDKVYKAHLIGFETECAELSGSHKTSLFKSLENLVSCDERLREKGVIRVLEIGVKTGENIKFYPKGTHLIGVDWNLKLNEYLTKGNRSWQFNHVHLERVIIGDGCCLKEIPSRSIDAVVTTRSLCSAKSPRSTLDEIHRVLTPGGGYFFMEHIPEDEGCLLRSIQKFLSRTGIWPTLFGDCKLDIDLITQIKNTNFKDVTWWPVLIDGHVSQPFHLIMSGRHALGIAIR